MEEKKDLRVQLSDIQRRRDELEDNYRSMKRRIESMDEEIMAGSRDLSKMANDVTTMKPDGELLDIYSERDQIFRDMRNKQMEFDEQIENEYKRQIEALDEEEKEIKAAETEDEEKPIN